MAVKDPRPSPSRPTWRILLTILLTLLLLSLFLTLFHLSPHRQLSLPPPRFNPSPTDVCHLIGNPSTPALWQFNSRSLCLSSRVCFPSAHPSSAYLHSAPLSRTVCHAARPDFSLSDNPPSNLSASCARLQREHVLCAHGKGLVNDAPECPRISPLPAQLPRNASVAWFEHLSVIVPDYPYTYNIYHYANVVSTLAHAIDALPALLARWGLGNVHAPGGARRPYFAGDEPTLTKLNVLFRAREDNPPYQQWKDDLLRAVVRHRIARNGLNVSVHYLTEDPSVQHVCVRNAVVLGRRGHCNVWAFPNTTEVPLDGMAVPADAVEFRRAVYEAFGIEARLPKWSAQCAHSSDCGLSELPPFTLGYARREGKPDPEKGYYHAGSIRRFGDADEAWFESMLRNETEAIGARLEVFTTSGNETLAQQVRNIVRVGFVVGIHGANLVNAMFMHPFGALFELLPAFNTARCYIAGSNSGLAYFRLVSSEMASPEESGCDPEDGECEKEIRQRMVKIGSEEDRKKARGFVRDGLRHLKYLHETFPNGIPVRYDEETAYYKVKVPT